MNSNNPKFSFKNAFYQGLTYLLVICLAILFFFLLYKSKELLAGLHHVLSILMPIILGVIVAYLVNPIVMFFERKIDELIGFYHKKEASHRHDASEKKEESRPMAILSEVNQKVEVLSKVTNRQRSKEKKKFPSRFLAIVITFAIVGMIIYFLAYLVVPQIYFNIRRLVYALPWQTQIMMKRLETIIAGHDELETWLNSMYKEVQNFLGNWMKQDMMDQLSLLVNGVFGVVGAALDFIIGLIVAVYVLLSKERFMHQIKKVIYAFLSDEAAESLIHILKESDRIFGGFIIGKVIDSFIIGVICFIFASLLNFPYVALISVIIGVTNVIPFFGPYVGAIPSAFLIFLADTKKGVLFLIFILILQQIDGNIIGPKILGESTGLSPFWVIFAIILGGGMFGVAGMIFGVPTFGVIYYLFKSFVNHRLEKKGKIISE